MLEPCAERGPAEESGASSRLEAGVCIGERDTPASDEQREPRGHFSNGFLGGSGPGAGDRGIEPRERLVAAQELEALEEAW